MPEITIDKLNEILSCAGVAIDEAERLYEKKIEEVAKRVVDGDNIRVILLSGPSGSGKTTTANLISDKIKALGEDSMVISMDDFYKNLADKEYPRDEDGELDFESPMALDSELMLRTLSDIIGGRAFSVPKYDFKIGGRSGFLKYPAMPHGCVIMEGIHSLNPAFSDPLPGGKILKLFVSVSTNINKADGTRIISGKKMRFVRRAVRDSIYRASSLERTLSMWLDVLRGEEKYLYPYKESADIKFDTFHTFEPAVLKKYILDLITDEIAAQNPYAYAVREAMIQMPEQIDEALVPESSLIREFIPGGIYENLY